MNKLMKKTSRYLKAIADPTRLKILKLLQHRTSCVCELTSVLGLAQPTVSRHLRVLEDAGFVESERRGLRMDYVLTEDDAPPMVRQLMGLVEEWHEDDQEIKTLRDRLDVTVAEICGSIPVKEDHVSAQPERSEYSS
ncbi:MAG: transcriptional regulator [Deltaproteobacteria bacterium]|nr:MAG: transcriptional regulator [Deltaproteobacteria bacterium]PXF55164.1 MAG: transcriptional regulator [Deltaproteobacteria bacterium]